MPKKSHNRIMALAEGLCRPLRYRLNWALFNLRRRQTSAMDL